MVLVVVSTKGGKVGRMDTCGKGMDGAAGIYVEGKIEEDNNKR